VALRGNTLDAHTWDIVESKANLRAGLLLYCGGGTGTPVGYNGTGGNLAALILVLVIFRKANRHKKLP